MEKRNSGARLIGYLKALGLILIVAVVVLMSTWCVGAIWFTVPLIVEIRVVLSIAVVVLAIGGLGFGIFRRRLVFSLLPVSVVIAAALVWWSGIEPSNERLWQQDVLRLTTAVVDGDKVTLRNLRRFQYRSDRDYDAEWYDKTVDLRQLDSLDLIAVYWMGDAISHTLLSFGFAGDQVAISIETRKEEGEGYSALAGFFRRFELYYVVGDESDIIGVRTTYREPPEDVYLYRTMARPENIRLLFLEYIDKINKLAERPEFYNTATTNCTTNLVMHGRAVKRTGWPNWKMLLSGYFPELVYERGGLYKELPFGELRRRSLVNGKSREATGSSTYSRLIRQGLPGIETH
jgi:hypothetical protein